jgi:transcriptional regulator with XRE-family HTH domain
MNIVGDRLKRLREGVKLSQKDLASKIGLTQSGVNRYENNQSEASYQTLLSYADYFDVSMDYIYGRTEKPQGELYDYRPKAIEDDADMRRFVEMCFDPNSSINERLKQTLVDMLGEVTS